MHRKRVTCELHDSYFRLMTIKHAIPKIELAIELLYNPVSWRSDELETRCCRESHHPAEGASGPPIEFGDQTSWWENAGMRTCPREAGPPGPRLSNPGERERHNTDGHKSGGGSIYCSSVRSPAPSHTQNLSNKVRGIYIFLKKSSLVFIIASICILHVDVYSCCIWLYNINWYCKEGVSDILKILRMTMRDNANTNRIEMIVRS